MGKDYILMGVKDQNILGKVYFCGEAVLEMKGELAKAMRETKPEADADRDDYDKMWDLIYHNTRMTIGYQFMSFKKEFFPIGKNVMKTFDVPWRVGALCPWRRRTTVGPWMTRRWWIGP